MIRFLRHPSARIPAVSAKEALRRGLVGITLLSGTGIDEYTQNRVIFSITLTPDQPYRLMR